MRKRDRVQTGLGERLVWALLVWLLAMTTLNILMHVAL